MSTLSAEELAALEELCEKATPGPWRWAEREENDKIAPVGRNGVRRAKPGRSVRDTWVGLLLGAPFGGVAERWRDVWDYRHVFALRWRDVRVTSLVNALPGEADAAFIAEARTAVPMLLARVRELEAALEFIGSLQPDGSAWYFATKDARAALNLARELATLADPERAAKRGGGAALAQPSAPESAT